MDELHPAVARTEATINTNIASTGEKSDKAAQQPARRKAATDAKNEQFEEWLRNWQPRNFLAERVRDGPILVLSSVSAYSWLFSYVPEYVCICLA